MSLESDIGALVAFSGFPCVANEYNGGEESYFVFTTSTQGLLFADDRPVVDREAVSLHLHCPHSLNTVSLRKQIKIRADGAGFTWPTEQNLSDKEGQHILFEFEREVDVDGQLSGGWTG